MVRPRAEAGRLVPVDADQYHSFEYQRARWGTVESRAASGQLSELELNAWRGLLRTHARLDRELDRELREAEGLSLSSYEVLLRLSQSDGGRMRMRDIADSLLVSRSGLTGVVNELERRRY